MCAHVEGAVTDRAVLAGTSLGSWGGYQWRRTVLMSLRASERGGHLEDPEVLCQACGDITFHELLEATQKGRGPPRAGAAHM